MATRILQGDSYINVTTDGTNTTLSGNTTNLAELIRDTIGTALTAGTGITVTTDDAGNTITIGNDGVGFALYSSGWPARPSFDTVFWVASDSAATTPGAATGNDVVILPPAPEVIVIDVSGDDTTSLTTGTAKYTFRMPYAFTLSAVRASLTTASTSGTPTIDINEGGTSVLSTKLTIDANELTSTTAATAAVISDTALADDAQITIDIDTAGTGAKGLKVYLIGSKA